MLDVLIAKILKLPLATHLEREERKQVSGATMKVGAPDNRIN